jgi:hypothetical protein
VWPLPPVRLLGSVHRHTPARIARCIPPNGAKLSFKRVYQRCVGGKCGCDGSHFPLPVFLAPTAWLRAPDQPRWVGKPYTLFEAAVGVQMQRSSACPPHTCLRTPAREVPGLVHKAQPDICCPSLPGTARKLTTGQPTSWQCM